MVGNLEKIKAIIASRITKKKKKKKTKPRILLHVFSLSLSLFSTCVRMDMYDSYILQQEY